MSTPDGNVALRGLRQMTVDKVTADTSSAYTNEGSPVAMPCAIMLDLQDEIESDVLKGDDVKYDVYSKPIGYKTKLQWGVLSFAAAAKFLGTSAPVSSGTTPNRRVTLTRKATDKAPPVRILGRVAYVGQDKAIGAYYFDGKSLKCTGFSAKLSRDGYSDVNAEFEGVPTKLDQTMYEHIELESDGTLPIGAADTTAPTVSSTTPPDADTGTSRSINPTITFSEDVQFNPGDYTLFVGATGAPVSILPTYDAPSKTVTFNPVGTLAATTLHRFGHSTNVKDAAGNRIATEHFYSFTTGS